MLMVNSVGNERSSSFPTEFNINR